MSDTGMSDDNQTQQQVEVNPMSPVAATSPAAPTAAAAAAVPEVENKPVTPVKRTPSKRISAVERAQRESEELVKTLGGSLDIEGGRKTRSSTRGTPSKSNVVDTPPAKKSRISVSTPKRGRGRKLEPVLNDETKTTPEKISADSANEDNTASSVVEKTAEKIEAKSSIDEENQQSPVKQDDKPEPMEVDSVIKEDSNTPVPELKPEAESTESAAKAVELNKQEEQSKESSDNGIDNAEKDRSSSVSLGDAARVEQVNSAIVTENNDEENNIGEKTNSLQEELPPPSAGSTAPVAPAEIAVPPAPAAPIAPTAPSAPAAPPAPTAPTTPVVPVAGNERKAESNDCCEPKIASPPISANNDGATPQYCN